MIFVDNTLALLLFFTFIHTLGMECDRGFDGLPFWRWGLVVCFAQCESVETSFR